MKDFQVSPDSVRRDPSNPSWTIPKAYDVWELPPGSIEKRYRFENYPARGNELAREYTRTLLAALYTSREHAHDLNK